MRRTAHHSVVAAGNEEGTVTLYDARTICLTHALTQTEMFSKCAKTYRPPPRKALSSTIEIFGNLQWFTNLSFFLLFFFQIFSLKFSPQMYNLQIPAFLVGKCSLRYVANKVIRALKSMQNDVWSNLQQIKMNNAQALRDFKVSWLLPLRQCRTNSKDLCSFHIKEGHCQSFSKEAMKPQYNLV